MDQHRLGQVGAGVRHRRIAFLAALVVALSVVLAAPAQAAPSTPAGLATTVTDPGGAPVLTWERTPGATNYQVEISADPAFGSAIETTGAKGTTNVSYVPAKALPNPAYWRVRSRDADGASAWATSSFAPPAAVPSLLSPASGATVTPPRDVPILRWSAVPGASSYVVRVGPDPEFTDPAQYTATTVKSTSLVFTPSTAATYWWQVQAQFSGGLQAEPSASRSFIADGIDDVDRASMSPNHESDPAEYVEDVVFDWDPVPGAVSYEIQVDTDQDFDTRLLDDRGIVSTRYAVALKNDQYYWRVRPVDAFGVKREWTQTLTTFRRAWPRQPQLEWPVDQAVSDPPLTGPVYFEWTPVRLASKYRIQIASEPNFQPATTVACETVHTVFVPSARNGCFPTPGAVHYWRVQALDGSTAVTDLISSQVHRFQYATWPVLPSSMLPADGYSGAAPTLSWSPVAGASRYRVVIYNAENGSAVEDEVIRTTAYTPRKNLAPKPADPVTYRWQVIPMSETGSGNGLTPGSQPRFTVTQTGAGSAASPEPVAPADGATSEYFPTLSWTPMDVPVVSGASKPPSYHVYVRPLGQQTVPPAEGKTVQPRFEDLDTNRLAPDTYEWWIEAVSDDGAVTTGSSSTFTIAPRPAITGEQSALRGTSLWRAGSPAGERCTLASCKFPETPIVSWAPDPTVGLYKVTISRDAELTNVVSRTFVEQPALLGTSALPDSQAGQPYYWTVQPCWSRSPEVCRPISHATRNFEKLSNKVEPLAPLTGAEVSDDITLTWRDYVDTNADPAESAHSDVTTSGRLEASAYRVQVDDNADFSSPIENVVVEQAQFTSPKKTYPEGPLYWRVQAIDASDNSLPWSRRQDLVKRSPAPTLTLPAADGTAAVPEFAWDPLPYAASYDIEVYRNDDTNASSGNRVISKTTKHVAYTHGDPLPTAQTPYVWRVRRVDATGRKGAWSAWGRFTVASASPVIDAPANNAEIEPNGEVFTWHMPADDAVQAASYVLEWRRIGSSTVTRFPTIAPAYAPTAPPADGAWEWRVVALDAAGKELGASSQTDEVWRQFNVAGTPVATAKPVIEADDGATVGSTLRALPPTWSQPGVTESWQWLRNNAVIPGQTGTTYVVAAEDVGKKISVRVTGSKAGYADGVTVSDPVTGGSGPGDPGGTAPPASTGRPGISGTVQVGGQLSATPGSWSAATTPKYAYQWLRNGAPIARATSSKYRLTPSDAAQAVSVRVTATVSGKSGVADSDAVTVPLMASTTAMTASPSPAKAKRNKAKVVVTVKVSVPAGGAPSGSIEIADRLKKKAKLLKVVPLPATAKGTVTVKVKLKGRGKHRLQATYRGDPQTSSSVAAVKVKVR